MRVGGFKMARNKVYMVCEDYSLLERFKQFCMQNGVEFSSYTSYEWEAQMANKVDTPLSTGQAPVDTNVSNVIPFPGNNNVGHNHGRVKTINELESMAIENAINEFNGNLTEAAKALGIGRATLYRKVKQYNIDPSQARRKKAA